MNGALKMATQKSRTGFAAKPRLTIGETTRLAEMAFRYVAWIEDTEDPMPPEEFARDVVLSFEALIADHAEIGGYPFLGKGYGLTIAEEAVKVPVAWRPGWGWPGKVSKN